MSRPRTEPLVARAFEIDGARGMHYAELPADTRERLATWLREGTVVGGAEIKPGRVYRYEDWIVKFFEFAGTLRERFRPSAAARSARRHVELQEIGTPKPVATLERRYGRSLIVMERIDGVSLKEVVADETDDPRRALRAFPSFMAGMHRRNVFHGDLHVDQMLWDGVRWYLLDLDGLRHPLRRLRPKPLIDEQWVRLHFDLAYAPAVADLYRDYVALAWPARDPAADWERIVDRQPEGRT